MLILLCTGPYYPGCSTVAVNRRRSAKLCEDVHPKVVQGLLGHATIPITLNTYSTYSQVLPSLGGHAARAMETALSALMY
jgi:hypothetical protein